MNTRICMFDLVGVGTNNVGLSERAQKLGKQLPDLLVRATNSQKCKRDFDKIIDFELWCIVHTLVFINQGLPGMFNAGLTLCKHATWFLQPRIKIRSIRVGQGLHWRTQIAWSSTKQQLVRCKVSGRMDGVVGRHRVKMGSVPPSLPDALIPKHVTQTKKTSGSSQFAHSFGDTRWNGTVARLYSA